MKFVVPIVLVLYGLLLLVGGFLGYTKSQSLESLITGGAAGAFAIFAAVVSMRKGRTGALIGAVVALAVAVLMGLRWLDGEKFMPSGMVTVVSAVVVVLSVIGFFSLEKKK